jgi:4'-phosphopantetheinyl transferase
MDPSLATSRNKIVYTRISRRDWEPEFLRLPAFLRERISKFKQRQDRDVRTAGYWLLSTSIRELTGTQPALDRIVYSNTGRPSLPEFPHIDFNLSHSGNYALCGVLCDGRIGVDIERVVGIDVEEGRVVFSDSIWRKIVSSNNPRDEFYRAWTRMEAVAKAEGFGIVGPVQSILCEEKQALCGDAVWHLLDVPIAGYSCHIASSRQLALADVEEVIET